MRRLRTLHAGLSCFAALYLLAAMLAGFTFHPGHAAPAIAMLALPDGTVPSLCLGDTGPGNTGPGNTGPGDAGKVTRSHSCDFCRLADAPGLLPESPGVLLHSISFLLVASLLPAGPVFKPRAVFRAPTRAPPHAVA